MNVQNQRSLPHLGGEACFKQIQKVKPLVQVFVGLLAHQNMEFLSAFSDWNFGDISSHTYIVTLFENFGITTLIGRGIGRDLIEFQNFVIRGDVLYTASAGCLLKANLRQPVIEFEVFYGKCLSLAELNDLIQKTEDRGFPTLVKEAFWRAPFERIQPDNWIFQHVPIIPSYCLSILKLYCQRYSMEQVT